MPTVVPQRVVVAPSGFKESLSATEVADYIARGVRRALPGAWVTPLPIVDGGEGTAQALAEFTEGRVIEVPVRGPVGQPVDSHVAELGGPAEGTYVVELAAAAGLRLVPPDLRDPGRTTTYGVGQLISRCLDENPQRIIVGCGDSGTSDGGAGMLAALGARLFDAQGSPVPAGGAHLGDVDRLDLSGIDPRLREVEIVVAGNVHNVLCGPQGVARVFGPQKGASPQQVENLAAGLDHWADLLEAADLPAVRAGLDVRFGPGTGASGGLGVALAAVLGARLRSRFDVLLDPEIGGVDLDSAIAAADLVITAEGAVDYQTPRGKVPAEVARRAKRYGKPVIALAGSIGDGATDVHDIGIDAVMGIITIPMDLAQAVSQAGALVADATERALRMVLLGAAMASRSEASPVG